MSWQVTAAPAVHAQPCHDCLAYRLDCDGGSVVITGDTVPCKCTIELVRDIDLLLHMSPGATNAPDPVTARHVGWDGPAMWAKRRPSRARSNW